MKYPKLLKRRRLVWPGLNFEEVKDLFLAERGLGWLEDGHSDIVKVAGAASARITFPR